ncbi:MAG: hypothetical protein Q7S39_00530 [Ignavibacteria bacterium]|nr:hypothetical protein [Ignavibacteria bacterium]
MTAIAETILFPGVQGAPSAESKSDPPLKNEWKYNDVSVRELVGYLPDITAAGDKYNYFNYIESRWTDGMCLKTSVVYKKQEHYKTGLLIISHPSSKDEVKGFYVSVTLPGERDPVSQLYIATTDREIAKEIHLEFIRRYNMILDASRLMRLGFEVLCNRKKEEAVNDTLLWLQGQHSRLIKRFDNKLRVSPNHGTALAGNILSQMARTIWEAMGEAAQRKSGKI